MAERRTVLLALAAACLVGIAFTWPLVLHPATTVIDDGTFDAYQFIWNVWWVNEALVHLHVNPFFTRYLFYPDGIGLLFHTFSASLGLAAIPFQILPGGAVTAHNLLVIAGPTLIVFMTYLLAREVTDDGAAALTAGLVAAVNPAMAWFVPIIYLTATYLVAALLWAWWRMHRLRRPRDVVFVLALVVALLFASQEYAMMALGLLALDSAGRVLAPDLLGLRRPWWPGLVGTWGTLGVALGALWLFAMRDPAAPPKDQAVLFGSAFLKGFVTPPWLDVSPFRFWRVLYLGTVPLLLLGVAMALGGRRAAFWLVALGIVLAMACGPFIAWEHPLMRDPPPATRLQPDHLAPGYVPGPYFVVYRYFKMIRFFRAVYRWVNVGHVLMGVLAAIGVAALRARIARPGLRAAVAVVPALAVLALGAAEVHGLRAPVVPVVVPTAYEPMIADPTPAAVVELPSGLIPGGFANFASRYMLYQTLHRKFLLDGTVARRPVGQVPLVTRRPASFAELPYVKWVVIHRDLVARALPVSQEQVAHVDGLLRTEGTLVRQDGPVELWQLSTFRPDSVH